jgi:conjugative transfer region protein TrbK
MDLKIATRLIAVLALGSTMLACVIPLRPDHTKTTTDQTLREPSGEPARLSSDAELLRCSDIGMAALDDAGCRKVWAENRRHFLDADRASALMPERATSSFPNEATRP